MAKTKTNYCDDTKTKKYEERWNQVEVESPQEHRSPHVGRLVQDLFVIVGVQLKLPDAVLCSASSRHLFRDFCLLPYFVVKITHLPTLGVKTHCKLKDGHVPNATIQAVCSILGAVFQELERLDGQQNCEQVRVAPLQEVPGHSWVPDKIGKAPQLASVCQVPWDKIILHQ